MALTYDTYCSAMRSLLVGAQNASDSAFEALIPRMIEYAELRIYRELDFLTTVSSLTSTAAANARNMTMPTGVIVAQSLNIITPAIVTNPNLGKRNPVYRTSIEAINYLYPDTSNPGVPKNFALLNDTTVVFGPAPDAAYTAEVVATTRPATLGPAIVPGVTSTTTFISTNLPDLFVAASMVFGTGMQRNFSEQSNDPQMGASWEAQYKSLREGVNMEELRRKAQSVEWTPYTPSPMANAPRDRAS